MVEKETGEVGERELKGGDEAGEAGADYDDGDFFGGGGEGVWRGGRGGGGGWVWGGHGGQRGVWEVVEGWWMWLLGLRSREREVMLEDTLRWGGCRLLNCCVHCAFGGLQQCLSAAGCQREDMDQMLTLTLMESRQPVSDDDGLLCLRSHVRFHSVASVQRPLARDVHSKHFPAQGLYRASFVLRRGEV